MQDPLKRLVVTQRDEGSRCDPKGVASALHVCAGTILLIYGASHFGFLTLRDHNHQLHNLVFPIINNWTLYLIVAAIETILGVACFIRRGHEAISITIVTFVGVMIWYRWAFYYAGGIRCSCTGLLGRLFHFTPAQERTFPVLTLMLLIVSASPFILRICKRMCRLYTLVLFAVSMTMTLGQLDAKAGDTIAIRGLLDWQDYDFVTAKPSTRYYKHYVFTTMISGKSWSICVTNMSRPRWWAQLVYDGSSTFIIQPATKYGSLATNEDQVPETNLNEVLVEGSARFLPESDEMQLSIGWFTYGFSKWLLGTNTNGFVELPLPSGNVRENPRSFGYKWLVNFSDGGLYASNCQVVRDHALDKREADELFRSELNYPDTLADYNDYQTLLRFKRDTPDGFVKLKYKCTKWADTSLGEVPSESKLEVYWWDERRGIGRYPFHVVTLKATNVDIRPPVTSLLPEVEVLTKVEDYRYKRVNSSRIFKYAEYNLEPGDLWKSGDDPILVARAAEYLEHGRKYTHWANNGRMWTSWLLLAVLLAPAVIVLVRRKQKQRNQELNNEKV